MELQNILYNFTVQISYKESKFYLLLVKELTRKCTSKRIKAQLKNRNSTTDNDIVAGNKYISTSWIFDNFK